MDQLRHDRDAACSPHPILASISRVNNVVQSVSLVADALCCCSVPDE